jgi:hypothetical protein
MRFVPALVLLLTVLRTSAAHAQVESAGDTRAANAEEPSTGSLGESSKSREQTGASVGRAWTERPFAVMGVMGLGTPVGLSAGAGTNGSTAQLATAGRLRLPVTRQLALSVGAGVSFGGAHEDDGTFLCWDCARIPWKWKKTQWLNMELAIEGNHASRFTWRAFLGYGHMLNQREGTCSESYDIHSSCPARPNPSTPYVGGAFGVAF